ncbi:MAG: helix-turn-helix domain-containing protein [Candidatus Aquirickettsiella gammari]
MNDVMQMAMPDSKEEMMESDNANVAMTTGEQLAAARQAKNWTVQFVAEQLKLSQVQIIALEANNFDALPKMVIVRGFVRAYAKLLKINGDGLVASLPKDSEPVQLEASLRPALSTPFVDSRLSLQGQNDNNRRYIIGAVALVIVVGVFLLVQATDFGKNFQAIFEKKEFSVAEAVITKPLLPETASDSESLAQTLSPIVAQPAATNVEPATSDATVNDKSPQAAEIVTASDAKVGLASVGDDAKKAINEVPLSLPPVTELFIVKFRQDSWIQVKTVGGIILSSHLAKAGTEESFSVKQALNVKIGNAAGVDALLRGQPLSISSERGNNVANLVVK